MKKSGALDDKTADALEKAIKATRRGKNVTLNSFRIPTELFAIETRRGNATLLKRKKKMILGAKQKARAEIRARNQKTQL
jgi:hypothetical protein